MSKGCCQNDQGLLYGEWTHKATGISRPSLRVFPLCTALATFFWCGAILFAGTFGETNMAHSLPPSMTLEQATAALFEGQLLIFPTETFYALGCDAMNADAVGAVFSLKKRPLSMPLPVVVASRDMLDGLAAHVDEEASRLMDRFWPGPLSIVLPSEPEVPDLITANAHRVAVRVSSHPAVQALCRGTGRALVASSANISGSPAPARQEDLSTELLRGVAGIFTQGLEPPGGLPSTVVDLRRVREQVVVRVLRTGAVSRAALEQAGFTVQDMTEGVPVS